MSTQSVMLANQPPLVTPPETNLLPQRHKGWTVQTAIHLNDLTQHWTSPRPNCRKTAAFDSSQYDETNTNLACTIEQVMNRRAAYHRSPNKGQEPK